MVQNESEGSKSQNQSNKKHDRADEKKEVMPFKKRVRFFVSDDIKEVSQVEINTGTKGKQIISSTSGHTDAAKENKKEMVPNKERTTYDKNADGATSSLPAMRKTKRRILSFATLRVKENCMKWSTGDEYLVDDYVSRKIHIGDRSGIQHPGEGGSHDGCRGVGDPKQVVGTKEIIEHEGGGSNECPPGSKVERNKGKKPVEYIDSTIVHDGKRPRVGAHGKQVHGVYPGPGYEEEQEDSLEEGEIRSNEVDTAISFYGGKQVHGAELEINVVESSKHSPVDIAIETTNDEYRNRGFHEQDQVAEMEYVGGDENNNRNTERVDDGVFSMDHDGGWGGEQVHIPDPATNPEESSYHSPVYITIENINDGNSLKDNHEMEQQIEMNNVGDGNGGINETVPENQDKKGKRSIEYVSWPIIQDAASDRGGKEPEGNDFNAPIVSGATDREQLELELAELLAIPVRILKELERESNAPHVGGEGGVREGTPTILTPGRSSDAIHEPDHDDQIQQASLEVRDGGNNNDVTIPHGCMPAQGCGEIMMLDPLVTRTYNQSIHEQGEASQEKPIVTRKVMELEPVSIKELGRESNAPHVGGEGGVREGTPTILTPGRSSDAIREPNHDDQIQQASPEVRDGGNNNDITIPHGCMPAKGRAENMMLDPLITRTYNLSIHEQGEALQEKPIVLARKVMELERESIKALERESIKVLERESNAPHVGGEGGVHEGTPTILSLRRSSDAIHERNHDDQIQQASPEVPDGGNNNDIAIPHGCTPAQGRGEIMMLDPLITRTYNLSIHEQGEASQEKPIVARKVMELERESNAPHVGGESGVRKGTPTIHTLGRSSDAIRERNHYDQIQQASPEVPDGGNNNNITISNGCMPARGRCEIMMLNPLITRTYNQSIHEQGEASQEKPIVTRKTKHDCGGSGVWRASVQQRANDHRIRFFGLDIPRVKEHEELEIMQQQSKPMNVFRLLGVDILVPKKELQLASATVIKDEESSDDHAPGDGGDGELPMQLPQNGLRLMGFDL